MPSSLAGCQPVKIQTTKKNQGARTQSLRLCLFLWIALALLMSGPKLMAQNHLAPVVISEQALQRAEAQSARGGINLAPHTYYLTELETQPTPEPLRIVKNERSIAKTADALLTNTLWMPSGSDHLRFGFNQKAIWLKTHVINQTNSPVSLLLEMGYPMLDEILILEVLGGKVDNWSVRGDRVQHRSQSTHHPRNSTTHFIHRLTLAPQAEKTLFIFIRTTGLLTIPIFIHEEEAYTRVARYDSHLQGLIIALLFTGMLLGILFAYAQVQRTDIWLSAHFATLGAVQLIISGTTQNILTLEHQMLLNLLLPSLLMLSALSITLFAHYFLKIPRHAPRLSTFITRGAMALLVLLPISGSIPYSYAIQGALLVQQVIFIFVAGLSIFAARHTGLAGKFFILAWFMFLTGDLLFLSNDIGIFPISYQSNVIWAVTLTCTVAALGLAFAETTRQFDQELKYRQRESNKVLQREVARRTAELNAMTNSALSASAEAVKSKEIAEAANNAKSEFLAVMSHEIRTPINGVLGMTDLLKDTPLNEQQQHYLDTIHSSGRNLLTILDDVLDLGKIESKHMSLQERSFALDDLIEDTFSVFTEYTRSNKVPLYLHMDGRLPATLYGDPVRLQQILVNLISNAFKFTEVGHIGVMIALELEDPSEPSIRFAVSDTGIGINPDQREKLFAPFSQADATTSRRYGGTGLGLAICERLITLMEGNIDAECNQAGGATFWFRIPLTRALEEPTHSTHMPSTTAKSVENAPNGHKSAPPNDFSRPQFDHVSVLILAQDPFLERSLVQIFSQINITPHVTHCTAEALKHLRDLPNNQAVPNLLMLDNDALDRSFPEFYEILSSLEARKPEHICVMSTLDSIHKAAANLKQFQGVSYIDKPLTLKRIATHLSSRLPTQTAPPKQKTPSESPWSGLKILVAEDNRVNQLVVKGMLNKVGIEPNLAENGQEAVDAYCATPEHFDLIFMDCEMPGKDGFGATEDIRAFESNFKLPNIPIVALSAHALPEHIQRCLSVGMNDHIAKPINREKLEQCFQTYFPLRSIA